MSRLPYNPGMTNRALLLPRAAILLCALLLVAGCAGTATKAPPAAFDDPEVIAWLGNRAAALAGGAAPTVEVIVDDGIQAELLPDGRLRLRTALLLRARDEAEITFIIAHELAHAELDHFARRERADWDPVQAEHEADLRALDTLRQMGLRADAGTSLLSAIDAELGLIADLDPGVRPLVSERLSRLWEFSVASGHPPRMGDGWRGLMDSRWESWFARDAAAGDARRESLLREHTQRPRSP
jgi:hypothetical protein